jgi:uncharacterized protein (DUF1330 family)
VPAFVISESTVLDETLAARYRSLAGPSIAHHGGRYVLRRAVPEAVEGHWPAAAGLVIVQFPTLERIHQWYASPEYAPALQFRHGAFDRRLLFADGVVDVNARGEE